MIWTLTSRAISDQAAERLRPQTDQQVTSVAFVLAREVQNELERLVDQTLAIIQDAWNKNSDSVDLGGWRKQLLALTGVADDIFVANERGVIVQGTLPRSIGMGFGSAYVTYPNGSLEMFDPDGTKNPDGKIPGADRIEARQFLMERGPPARRARAAGAVGASSSLRRASPNCWPAPIWGQNGVVGLADTKRGALQAIVGSSAQFANMDLNSDSELIEQMRKNDSGIWAGVSPIDHGSRRIIAYPARRRKPGHERHGRRRGGYRDPAARRTGRDGPRPGQSVASVVVLTIASIVILDDRDNPEPPGSAGGRMSGLNSI